MGRVLGLDVGSVRVGVALSDPLQMIAQPLVVIDTRRSEPWSEVARLVQEHEVERVVVGLPVQLDGRGGLAVKAVEAFVTRLREHIQVPIEMWDERLTTAQAERVMIDADVRRRARRQKIDKVAAALILQGYLDSRGPGGHAA